MSIYRFNNGVDREFIRSLDYQRNAAVLHGKWFAVNGNNTVGNPDGSETAVPFSLSAYPYLSAVAPNNSSKRHIVSIGQPELAEVDTYSTDPTGVNTDGTWTGASAWQLYDYVYCELWKEPDSPPDAWDVNQLYQFQNKIKIVGPVKGTLIKWPTITTLTSSIGAAVGSLGDPFSTDPLWGTSLVPISADYYDLADGVSLEITVDIPSAPPNPSPGVIQINSVDNLKVFRYGKHPSDFYWYPL